MTIVEKMARAAHDAYEKAAKEVGWETQASCRVTFDQLPAPNRLAMFASVRAVLSTLEAEGYAVVRKDDMERASPRSICNRAFSR